MLLVRWTIGPVKKAGFACLAESVRKMQSLYPNANFVICHNGLSTDQKNDLLAINIELIHQEELITNIHFGDFPPTPIGVAWKLYPPRLNLEGHEIFIDNDLIINEHIDEIDRFITGDTTLLLQEKTRHYGKFERHVPPGYSINSGLFGLPPHFNFEHYIKFYTSKWEENCGHSSKTWDEQGLVAAILLGHKHIIIPDTTITNCEKQYTPGKGLHFIGLNRRGFHTPFADYRTRNIKIYL